MKTFKTIVADGDDTARAQLCRLLASKSEIEVVAVCRDGLAALKTISAEKPDLVILEVELADISGFEIVDKLRLDRSPVVIFTATTGAYALHAFEVEALDYIQKPIDSTRLDKGLARMKRRLGDSPMGHIGNLLRDIRKDGGLNRFIIKQSGEYHLIQADEIICIESDGNYSRIITQNKKFLVRCTLTEFDEQLSSRHFYRISRSQIVNIDYVIKLKDHLYGNYLIELKNGTTLKMSKNYKQLLEALKYF